MKLGNPDTSVQRLRPLKSGRLALLGAGAGVLAALTLAGAACAGQPPPPEPQPIRVIAFGGVSTVPLLVAEDQGLFARHGVAPVVEFTPNSKVLREGLAAGTYDIAHAAVDNAIAMVDTAGADVVIVMGHDDSMNELFVQPAIESIPALRGKTVIVDAPNTAYALQARKILLDQGLEPGRDYTLAVVGGTPLRLKAMKENPEYAASMLNPPFSIQAGRAGLKSLGTAAQLIGPYQGPGAFVLRAWGREHRDALVGYIAAYIEALRWFLDPANKTEAVEFLATKLNLEPEVAEQAYAQAVASPGGLAPDAQLSIEGLKNVLRLRAEIEGQWDGTPPPPDRYYDLTYREAALSKIAGSIP
jgi:ABC-type nitrate/sulfonate/bicarbonate transport system substrate-binding protein